MFDSAGRELEIYSRLGFVATGPRFRIARRRPERPIEQLIAISDRTTEPEPDEEETEE
jgi:hypothetical protein